MEKSVFILGSRGYTKNYGGWETLVKNLLDNWKDTDTKFYVFEIVHNEEEAGIEVVNGITCIRLFIKQTGYIAMVLFDIKALFYARKFIKENKIINPIIYALGPRIGMLFLAYRPWLKNLDITVMTNPAGLEWKRGKWNWAVQQYVKVSAYTMAKACDYMICDSKGIVAAYDRFIKSKRPEKVYIAYGTYPSQPLEDTMPKRVEEYFSKHHIKPTEFYLVLGRFVPENNYEYVIKEFMKSKTNKELIIICNVAENKFYQELKEKTEFESDKRIKFVGAIYDKEILNYVRQYAHAYIHGHSVGGTNPGLLEAMSATDLNLLYDVVFNREVGEDAAKYFGEKEALSELINNCDKMSIEEKKEFGKKAKQRMTDHYTWEGIVKQYEKLFDAVSK